MSEPKVGIYYISRHLLGEGLDCNTRFLNRRSDDGNIASFAPTGAQGEWTPEDDKRLNAIADFLNHGDGEDMTNLRKILEG